VLDLRLPDMSGFDLLAQVQQDPKLRDTPIIVFTGRELSEEEETELRKKAKSIVLKGVRSPERLLDETALFLHRVIADLPESKQHMIETLHESDEPLTGRKVLVVDDDIRNIFALNSLLERHNMQVITATNGQEAINLVESTDDLSLVLMDHAPDPQQPSVPHVADHRPHCESHEGRPGEVPGGGRLGLCCKTCEHGPAALAGTDVVA
jgi:CheY-like chemotaxis protein